MSRMPPAARASASAVFCTHTPTAPASICSLASAALLCIFAWARQRTWCLRQNSAMRARLRRMASMSMTSAGVSIAATLWPTSAARVSGSEAGVVVGGFIVQVLRVGPADQREAFRGPEQAIDRAVGQFPGARRIDLLPGGDAVQRVEHAAMRH